MTSAHRHPTRNWRTHCNVRETRSRWFRCIEQPRRGRPAYSSTDPVTRACAPERILFARRQSGWRSHNQHRAWQSWLRCTSGKCRSRRTRQTAHCRPRIARTLPREEMIGRRDTRNRSAGAAAPTDEAPSRVENFASSSTGGRRPSRRTRSTGSEPRVPPTQHRR